MKMNLDHIARELSADLSEDLEHKISGKATKAVVARVFEYIAASMAEGNEITIPAFGKFIVRDKPEREGRNPRTGETMTVPAKRVLKFTPAKQLKDRVMGQ